MMMGGGGEEGGDGTGAGGGGVTIAAGAGGGVGATPLISPLHLNQSQLLVAHSKLNIQESLAHFQI